MTARQLSNFDADIQIDKGRDQGVDDGMPVVGAGGLVGQVTFASHNSATIQLVTDGQSKVGVSFGNPPNDAVADGQGVGVPLSGEFIQPGTPITKGEVMYTNGLQEAEFPSGIPVARVQSVRAVSGASALEVTATPMADLTSLTYVDVVQWRPAP